jgi:hypothetical protein
MKISCRVFCSMIVLLCCAGLNAQDVSKTQPNSKKDDLTAAVTPLRVQVVFTEFDGEKKVSNLPYTFSVNADERRTRPNSQVRNGVRIPISTDKDKFQYIDIGTNIDCSAMLQDDGRFKLTMNMERSAISSESTSANNAPIVRQFRAEINPVLKDGQTVEGIVATDPLNGHVYHVSVTLTVLK